MARAKAVSSPHGERLASIEAMFASHAAADALAFADLKVQIAATHTLVEEVKSAVNKRTSFVAGIVFAVSAGWAAVYGIIQFWPFKV